MKITRIIASAAMFGFLGTTIAWAGPTAESPIEKPNTNAEAPMPKAEEPKLPIKEEGKVEAKRQPKIQLAILLDTSGSMDGLIDQARSQIWKIINEFATVKQNSKTPIVEVALYEYGKSSLPAKENFLRQIVGLSTDLDKVSEELFALETNGGEEFCGAVITSAINGLTWSDNSNDYKAIFIAGNEEFTQGSVDYSKACKDAIAKGVIVNTIHCGGHQEGINGKWQAGALLADGSYMSIDHNARVAHIASPFDKDIVATGEKLNETYVPYGKEGQEGAERQKAQDTNAEDAADGADVNRAIQKKNHTYRNDKWDLIDALDAEKVKLEDVKAEDLPEDLRKLSKEELKKKIDELRKERKELKEKLTELEKKRNEFVAKERKKNAEKDGKESLDEAMIKAIREQAGKKNFKKEE